MAVAGWYPDPSGRPRSYRYWDGARWSEQVAGTPYGPPPPGMAPPPPPVQQPPPTPAPPRPPVAPAGSGGPGGFGAPTVVPGSGTQQGGGFESYAAIGPLGPPRTPGTTSYGGSSPQSPPGGEREGDPSAGGRTLVLVLTAIGMTLLLGVISFLVVRELIDDDAQVARSAPTRAATPQPTPQPTPAPTPEPTPAEPSPAPLPAACTSGRPGEGASRPQGRFLTGGGVRLRRPDGFDFGDQAPAFTFADGVSAPSRLVEEGLLSSWVAVYALGGLTRANGFDTPQQAAETVLDCMTASPDFYLGFSGVTELTSEQVTVDGAPAWRLTEEVRIDSPDLTVEGDVATVVVVDTGDPQSYGLFISVVPIGDDELIAGQDAAVQRLRVR